MWNKLGFHLLQQGSQIKTSKKFIGATNQDMQDVALLLETWYGFMYQLLDLDELKNFLAYGELSTLLLIKVML